MNAQTLNTRERLNQLQRSVEAHALDAYIVPMSDDHISEYVGPHWKRIAELSGFTGSSGTLVVGRDRRAIWVDGRYHLQAEEELQGCGTTVVKVGLPGAPTLAAWLEEHYGKDARIAADGRQVPLSLAKELAAQFASIRWDLDLVSPVWQMGETVVEGSVFEHLEVYSGASTASKLAAIEEALQGVAESVLLTALDDVAFALNIRGQDVPFTPVVYSFLYVSADERRLYVERAKLSQNVRSMLATHDVAVLPYEAIYEDLKLLPEGWRLWVDPSSTNAALVDVLPTHVQVVERTSPVVFPKILRNPVQIRHLNETAILEGVALVRLSKFLKERAVQEGVTEYEISQKMSQLRLAGASCLGDSFQTIAAYGANAAKMHYSPQREGSAVVEAQGFLLVDTGGQYLGGTTDTTRTFAMGPLTQEMKENYTRTLIAHIRLARSRFLKGTSGPNLDILARQPMWEVGMDYKSGTGHGVGYLLSVHEGPQRLAIGAAHIPLQPGMVLTDEPGVYKDGAYGIRIENMLLVQEASADASNVFYDFGVLTLCPIDLDPVLPEMLRPEEREYLNRYHEEVVELLSPHLNPDETAWLRQVTQPI